MVLEHKDGKVTIELTKEEVIDLEFHRWSIRELYDRLRYEQDSEFTHGINFKWYSTGAQKEEDEAK